MSSHDAEVRAVLRTQPGVQLQEVHAAVAPFCERWQIGLQEPGGGEFGGLTVDDGGYGYEQVVELRENGTLLLNLFCCMNVGMPDGLEELCGRLNAVVSNEGGVVEIVDLDTSPSNDDGISLRCVGASEQVRKAALIHYAFERAWDLIAPIVPREKLEAAAKMCAESA